MATFTAKVFKSGNAQAIRFPKALRLRTLTVRIEKTGRGLLILDPKAEMRRVKALAKLYGSCPDLPVIEPLRCARPVVTHRPPPDRIALR